MTDFDNTFPEDQWAIIKNYANRRFIFDYKPLLTHYLGDILTEPVKKYNNDDVVFQVSFEHGLNKNQNDKCVNTSKKLKNLLKQKLKILKKDKDNKLDAKEAFMILNSFEQRWLEPDNISFNSNNDPQINIWGINPVHIPEFIPIKKFVEIK